MGDAPVERGVRAAAFETACPEPTLIGKEHADPTFTHMIEHQQWFVAGIHNRCAFWLIDVNNAEPATPVWRLLRAPFQAPCYRMTFALFAQTRIEGLFFDIAGWCRGQYRKKRCIGDRHVARIFGTSGDEERASLLNVIIDIVVIEQRQNIAVLVAVKNDEVKLLDLIDEEFARWKCDQRKFVDRSPDPVFRADAKS